MSPVVDWSLTRNQQIDIYYIDQQRRSQDNAFPWFLFQYLGAMRRPCILVVFCTLNYAFSPLNRFLIPALSAFHFQVFIGHRAVYYTKGRVNETNDKCKFQWTLFALILECISKQSPDIHNMLWHQMHIWISNFTLACTSTIIKF